MLGVDWKSIGECPEAARTMMSSLSCFSLGTVVSLGSVRDETCLGVVEVDVEGVKILFECLNLAF